MDVKTPNDLKQCGYHYLFYSRGEVGIPGMEGTRKASLIHGELLDGRSRLFQNPQQYWPDSHSIKAMEIFLGFL